jgi:excinuclease UvrABC nuclease subunit
MAGVIETELGRLITWGFIRSGTWRRDAGSPPRCEGDIPKEPGVYVFVESGHIRYVGAAKKCIRSRMDSYQRRQRDRSSSRPVHRALAKAVTATNVVEVYTRVIATAIQVGPDGLPVDHLVGLEAGLIEKFKPEWNRRGRKLVADKIET